MTTSISSLSIIGLLFLGICSGAIRQESYEKEWRAYDFFLPSKELLSEAPDMVRVVEINGNEYGLHDLMTKDIERIRIESLPEWDVRYHIKYANQEVVIIFGITQKGNGLLYIPVSGNQYQAIKVYDEHDDGIVFNPACGKVILDHAADGRPAMTITIHIESTGEPDIPVIHCTEQRHFILTDRGYFNEISKGDDNSGSAP